MDDKDMKSELDKLLSGFSSPERYKAKAAPWLEELPTKAKSASGPPAVFVNDISFDIRYHGYDRRQVEDYINAVTEEFNAMCRRLEAAEEENRGLRRALSTLDAPPGRGGQYDRLRGIYP